jgi:mannose-6-phosphate isomerase-like protein (cupin superfamily)
LTRRGNSNPFRRSRSLGLLVMTALGTPVAVGPGQGPSHRIGEDTFVVKGDFRSVDDAFSVIEYRGAPGVPGPPPHLHRGFVEAWYILEGEVSFVAGGRAIAAKSGAYLLVPRGVPHTFQVEGTTAARWLGIFSPGRYVRLLEELGPLIPARGPADLADVRRLFGRYDTELVAP